MKLRHTVLSPLSGTGRSKLFYAQLVQTSGYNTNSAARDGTAPLIKISGGGQEVTLGEGDGVFISEARLGEVIELENVGGGRGELIMFETDKK